MVCRVLGWKSAGKPVFEINSLSREVTGNTVPLPKTLLKFILTLVMPRVIRQKIQEILPVELGNYLANASQGVHVSGEASWTSGTLCSNPSTHNTLNLVTFNAENACTVLLSRASL